MALTGALIAGLVNRGKQGEVYSSFNHFISESGELGVAKRPWAFNWGLIHRGILLLAATLNLGLALPCLWGKFWRGFWDNYCAQLIPGRRLFNGSPETPWHRGGNIFPGWAADGAVFHVRNRPPTSGKVGFPQAARSGWAAATAAFGTFLVIISRIH